MELVAANANIEGLSIDTGVPGVIRLSAANSTITGKVILSNVTMRIKEGLTGTAFMVPSAEGLWKDAEGQYSFTSLAGKLLSVKAPDMRPWQHPSGL